jgi:hypothetical protein
MKTHIDPKVDYAFKHVFGREESKPALVSLLNAVLQPAEGKSIASLELLNPFNEKSSESGKLSIVDIKARDESGRQFLIEVQMRAGDSSASERRLDLAEVRRALVPHSVEQFCRHVRGLAPAGYDWLARITKTRKTKARKQRSALYRVLSCFCFSCFRDSSVACGLSRVL